MLRAQLPKIVFAAAMLTLVAGCAVEPRAKGLEDMRLTGELVDKVQKEGKVQLAGTDGVICRREYLTGSHLAYWRCDTVEGADSRANASQSEIQRSQGAPKPKITGF